MIIVINNNNNNNMEKARFPYFEQMSKFSRKITTTKKNNT